MIINVVDVEATCWEKKAPAPSEIIEIGIAQVDLSARRILWGDDIFVKPTQSDTLSEFCTNLTSITDDMVFSADEFPVVAKRIVEEDGTLKHPWVSWGQYDFNQFQRDSQLHGVKNPMGRNHLNLKLYYSLKTRSKQVGMDKALQQLGLTLNGTHHRALDDALNIAKIALAIL